MPEPAIYPLPNLVIAGVTKAGTTSLFGLLGQHPDVGVPDTKELDHYAPVVAGLEPPPLSEYAAHFRDSGDHPVLLEASPRYFIGGPGLVRRLVADLSVDGVPPKVLVALREPVSRMWSSYTYKRSKDRLPAGVDFPEFVRRCRLVHDDGLVRDPAHAAYRTLASGVYADFLGDWVEGLGADLRVVFAEDLLDPAAELRDLCVWLGLDPAPVDGFDLGRRNATAQPRSQALRQVALGVNRRLAAVGARDSGVGRALRSVYGRVNTGSLGESMAAADRAALVEFYAPTLPRLRALLEEHGRTRLPDWLRA